MHSKKKIVLTVILIFLIALLGVLMKMASVERSNTASELKKSSEDAKSQDAAYSINVFSENTDKFEGQDILVSPDEFCDESSVISYNGVSKSCLRYKSNISVDSDDLLLLYFVAYTDETSVKIGIDIGEHFEAEYPVTTDKTAYYIPVKDLNTIDKIKIYVTTDMAKLYVGDVYLVNYADASVNDIKTGMYNLCDYDETELGADDGIGSGAATAAVADGGYLYAIYDDVLSVCDIENGGVISTLYGLGKTRDIEFCRDNTALVVTSRESDVYFIDITDVYNPEIVSHYGANGMAYGLDVCGDFVFFSSRYFGTEIVDISDINNPAYVSAIKSEDEHVDCLVVENYIYISCWNEKKIIVYDISDPITPESVFEISVDGYVYGLFADGDYLYAAIGYSSENVSSDINDCGYGGGNGMEIFDITDRANPEWVSSVRIDGRYYSRLYSMDFWKVYVSDGTAYLTNVVNGVYAYDVTDPAAPVRTAHYTVATYADDEERKEYDNTAYIYPYGSEAYYNEAVADVALTDGALYICGFTEDIYKVEDGSVSAVQTAYDDSYITVSGKETEEISAKGYDVEIYSGDTPVYSTAFYDGYIYAGCEDGIHVLDEDLNVIDIVETDDAVRDMRAEDGYLYTAQGRAGFVIYEINAIGIEKISDYNTDSITRICSNLEISPGGNYAVVQFSWDSVLLIDISDIFAPKEVEDVEIDIEGATYYRNICSGIVNDRYIGIYSSQHIMWLDFGNDVGVSIFDETTNPFYGEQQGIAAYGQYAVAICQGGYVYYDPEAENERLSLTYCDTEFYGKNTVYGTTMAVTNSQANMVYIVNISKPVSPRVACQFSIEGTPYMASITDDYILVAGGYSGLIKLSK